MDPKLESFLIQVIPIVGSIIRDFVNRTGKLPTDAEVIAKLKIDSDRVISIGEQWLEAHR